VRGHQVVQLPPEQDVLLGQVSKQKADLQQSRDTTGGGG
jgi:hypothetical protein